MCKLATPKGERNVSKNEFDALYYKIHDDAEDMIEHGFRAKNEIVQANADYISIAGRKLRSFVWDMINNVKLANALYPTTHEELVERRLAQDRALGNCASILTLYDMVMQKLNVRGDMGVEEIKHVSHEINAIRAWRSSDNKRFKDLQ